MMTKNKIKLHGGDTSTLYKWDVKKPIAKLLLIHGSKENIFRYREFIEYLNQKNVSVYSFDLPGHGHSGIDNNNFGHMGEDAAEDILKDIRDIYNKNKSNKVKNVIFGHSMGSFIARAYASRYGDCKNYIISGTNEQGRVTVNAGLLLLKATKFFKGKKKTNILVDKNSYKKFDKYFPGEGKNAWLSTDKIIRKEYEKDKLNARKFTNESFIAMLKWLKYISKKSSYLKLQDKNFVILAGEKDPVGSQGKGPRKVHRKMQKCFVQSKLKLYKNEKHELHNSRSKQEFFIDIIKYINNF